MYIARQPIFNRLMKIYGYELLFRAESGASSFGNTPSSVATAAVLGGLFEQGIDRIVGKSKAFINFDYEFILSENIELIDPKTLVIEVLESVAVDEKLIDRIKDLKKKGYKIALDDFEESLSTYPIVPIADIIKYDIIITPLDTIEREVEQALLQGKTILAEKIENIQEFQKAKEMGFQLFQGYFFSKPKIVEGSKIKKSAKIQYSMILNELKKDEPSYNAITEIIESDVNLAYRAMKVMSNRRRDDSFRSIKDALVRMGFRELERWINVLMLQELSADKPTEIMKLSLVRSKFGEYIASNCIYSNRKEEVSMMCLFSMLDAIMDAPMTVALDGMMISDDVFNALVYHQGSLKPICDILTAYEAGDWETVNVLSDYIHLNPKLLSPGYIEAIHWVTKFFESIE